MKTPKEIMKALDVCVHGFTVKDCKECPYYEKDKGFTCINALKQDAIGCIQELEHAQRNGRWEEYDRCSVCGDKPFAEEGIDVREYYNYCPRCGARMD